MSHDPLDNLRGNQPPEELAQPTVPLEVLLTHADKQWLASIHIESGHVSWFRAK